MSGMRVLAHIEKLRLVSILTWLLISVSLSEAPRHNTRARRHSRRLDCILQIFIRLASWSSAARRGNHSASSFIYTCSFRP